MNNNRVQHACFVCKKTRCLTPKTCATIFLARCERTEVKVLRLEDMDPTDLFGLPVDLNGKREGWLF